MSSDGSAEWHPAVRINAFGWHTASGGGRPASYFRMSWRINLTPVDVRACTRLLGTSADGWRMLSLGVLADGSYYQRGQGEIDNQEPRRFGWEELPLELSVCPANVTERRRADVEREWLDALHDLLGGAREVRRIIEKPTVDRRVHRHYAVRTSRWEDTHHVEESAMSLATAGGVFPRPFGESLPPRDWDGYTPIEVDVAVEYSGFPYSIRLRVPGDGSSDTTFIFRPCDTPFVIEKPV